MRTVFTSRDGGTPLSKDALAWRVGKGEIQRIARAAYVDGPSASVLEQALAVAAAAHGVNTGRVAAALRRVDCPPVLGPSFIVGPQCSGRREGARRLDYPAERVVFIAGIPVVDGVQMLVDLAGDLGDIEWEWSLESSLFRRHTTITAVETALPELSRARTKGVSRIRRVLEARPPGAPPTESLLETLMVQLARTVGAPTPTRQLRLFNEFGEFEARVDLCWPEIGLFVELDGQQHRFQPVYDANRQTRVVAATGWLCARFTWDEIRNHPAASGRRLLQLIAQASRRALPI